MKSVTIFFTCGHDQHKPIKYKPIKNNETAGVLIGDDRAPPGFGERDTVVHPWVGYVS